MYEYWHAFSCKVCILKLRLNFQFILDTLYILRVIFAYFKTKLVLAKKKNKEAKNKGKHKHTQVAKPIQMYYWIPLHPNLRITCRQILFEKTIVSNAIFAFFFAFRTNRKGRRKQSN